MKDLGQFYKYLVSWWHENMFVRVGPNGEPIATASIWLERPEILWLILGSSLSCTPIVWSISTFMKKKSIPKTVVSTLEGCWLISEKKSKLSLTEQLEVSSLR